MEKWKGLALLSVGFSVGLAFAVACGGDSSTISSVPGVPPANAQTTPACSSYQLMLHAKTDMNDNINEIPRGVPIDLPAGWVPWVPVTGNTWWLYHCVP